MSSVIHQLKETVAFLQHTYSTVAPEVGIVLGSGLGNFLQEVKISYSIDYKDIPNFPVASVAGHAGKLVFGELQGKQVVVMAGRFHYYEGYTPAEVVFPIRVMKQLGIGALLLSNAAGGVNGSFRVGDLMVITDHISFSVRNPLIGVNEELLGPRFPDMSTPYSRRLIQLVQSTARELGILLQEGVYYGVTGPSFETRAEYKMIRLMGADAVGMSTVQEVIAACHMGLPVLAVSVITDMGIREEETVISHEEVLREAALAEPKLAAIFKQLIAKL